MKTLGLILNKDERALVRKGLSEFGSPDLPNSLKDGLDIINQANSPIDLLILDQRYDSVMKTEGTQLEIMDLISALEKKREIHSKTLILAILEESDNPDTSMVFREAGVDKCLQRPLSIKDILCTAKELHQWIAKPPPDIQINRIFRSLIQQKQYKQAADALKKAVEAQPGNTNLKLMLAQCLMNLGADQISMSVDLLKEVAEKFPSSQATKTLLAQSFQLNKNYTQAFLTALDSCKIHLGNQQVEQILNLALILYQEDKNPLGVEETLKYLQGLEGNRFRQMRIDLVNSFTKLIRSDSDQIYFLQLLEKQADIRSHFVSTCLQLCDQVPATNTPLRLNLLKTILQLTPGNPPQLIEFVQYSVENLDFTSARTALNEAFESKKTSPEYYQGLAILELREGNLREASDAIHAGRKSSPSMDCWQSLSAEWSELHKKKSETP